MAKPRRWPGRLGPVLAGVVVAMGQAPLNQSWLAVVGLCFALWLGLTARNPRQAGWRGFGVGFGFALITFSWIVEPFLVDVKTNGWMAPFALVLMAAGLGVFWAAAYWGAHRFSGHNNRALALPVALTVAEMLRAYALSGFPWAMTSYFWISTPIYQFAAYIGPHGLNLLTLLICTGLSLGVMRRRLIVGALSAIALGAGYGGGMWLQQAPQPAPQGSVLRLLQPNADQKSKWDPAMIPVFYNRQLRLSAEPGPSPVDVVIWPEVAVPFLLSDPTAPFDQVAAAAQGAQVILGAQRLQGAQAYNSLGVVDPSGEITHIYDKNHLVPFGEYIPGGAVLSRIGLRALTAKYGYGYSAGPGPRVLDLGGLGKVLPLICYESIFPHEIRRVDTRPDWMLLITNDAWFGTLTGPYQHLAQARARAIEFGLPMVRVANTGITALIDARGQVVKSLPLGGMGRLDVVLPGALPPTLYWKYGDIPVAFLLIVLGLAVRGLKPRKSI